MAVVVNSGDITEWEAYRDPESTWSIERKIVAVVWSGMTMSRIRQSCWRRHSVRELEVSKGIIVTTSFLTAVPRNVCSVINIR